MNKDNFLRFIIADPNRLVVSAIAEKVSAIATENHLRQRAQWADKRAFRYLLYKIPNREAQLGDDL